MQTVTEKQLTRQQKLKIRLIETRFDVSALVRPGVRTKQAVSQMLYNRDSIPADFRDLCISLGIPADLLPPPTRKKADLLRENMELRQRLDALEGQRQPQAQAG